MLLSGGNAEQYDVGFVERVSMRLESLGQESDDTLHFEVSDDGPGFDVAATKGGQGYMNMSDRLGAIGGSVDWASAPGEGATITGTIPL